MNAKSGRPPKQAWFPKDPEQSRRFCSLNETSFPVLRKCWPSRAPVAEKAQQEPQRNWFLISVTAPLVLQSISVGASNPSGAMKVAAGLASWF